MAAVDEYAEAQCLLDYRRGLRFELLANRVDGDARHRLEAHATTPGGTVFTARWEVHRDGGMAETSI